MEKQKRERSGNFSAEETNLLISLIETKISIIENKKSDATTWQNKEKAWKDIENAFNSASSSVFRDHKHLKLKYEAIKRDTRKKSAMVGAEHYKTGGGTSSAPPLTTVQEKVKSMILSVEVNESQFDSDLVLPNSSKNIVIKLEEDSEPPKKKVCVESQEETLLQNSSKNIVIKLEEDSEPPETKECVESQEETLLQSKPREKRLFDRLSEEKLEIAKIQKKLVTEELEQKLIQRKLLQKELEHKEIIYELEKQNLLLKIELLKNKLGET